MLLPGTEIHIVVFIILLFEMVIFFFQIVYYLSRPTDQKRLWFLVLLFLMIYYNTVSGFLPDSNIPIPISIQNIFAYTGGLFMSMYFPFYFYKAFDLKKLKFYAYGGSLLFLMLPFLIFFLIPYLVTGNLDISRKLVVVIPFFYALSFLYSLTVSIRKSYIENPNKFYNEEIIGMYLANLFWISLPIIVYYDGSQLLENSFANAGLLVMTILFIRSAIRNARNEYNELLISESKLQELNEGLLIKVKERTLELEHANELRTQTLINLAHETKTPLTLVNNYLTEYINKYGKKEELILIKHSIERLTKDVINFFDMERMNRGFHVYDHNQISDLSKILLDNIQLFKQYASKKNITVVESIEPNLFVKADSEALFRITNNLIENAIKYTNENGTIKINLHTNNGEVEFTVKDNGLGISPNLQSKIFDLYYQIDSSKKSSQGMGIGLSIVKKIVEGLNGKIILNSDPENYAGTTISIKLSHYTLKDSDEVTVFNENAQIFIDYESLTINEEVFNPDKYSILIVEDNIPLLNFLVNKLNEKYNVYYAVNGTVAIEKLKTIKHLDLIISDVMMEGGNGFEFYDLVSAQKKLKHIPFIFLTAKSNHEDRLAGLSMGAIDYINKPFHVDELINKIDSILGKLKAHINAIIQDAYDRLLIEDTSNEKVEHNKKDTFEDNCFTYHLTTREVEIALLLSKGKTYKSIANDLFISESTVAKHVQNIFEKVEVNNKVELLNKLTNTVNN